MPSKISSVGAVMCETNEMKVITTLTMCGWGKCDCGETSDCSGD